MRSMIVRLHTPYKVYTRTLKENEKELVEIGYTLEQCKEKIQEIFKMASATESSGFYFTMQFDEQGLSAEVSMTAQQLQRCEIEFLISE